jgi:hypothetical protein
LTIDIDSALFVPDFGSSSHPYIRSLPHTTFACLPIKAHRDVRDVLCYKDVEGTMDLSEVESTCQVQLHVPQMKEEGEVTQREGSENENGHHDGGEWLNVTVWKDSEEGSTRGGQEQGRLEDAVRAVWKRYVSALRLCGLPPPDAGAVTSTRS